MDSKCLVMAIAAASLAACSAAPQSAPDENAAPLPSPVATPAAVPTRDDDMRAFLLQEYPGAGAIRYAAGWTDLDGDGEDEAILHVVGPYFCGTGGCPTAVLTRAGAMWRKVGDISVSRAPIGVANTQTNGWKDLVVSVSGGGGPSGMALLKFDGEAYPSNPTVAPAEMTESPGTIVIAEDPEFIEIEAEAAGGS